jgi:hypothetical protein
MRVVLLALAPLAATLSAAHDEGSYSEPMSTAILTMPLWPMIAGWLMALIALCGHPTRFVAVLGSIGCLVAAGGAVFGVLFLQGFMLGAWVVPALVAGVLLPFLCLGAHVARVIRHRRAVTSMRVERGF